VKPCDDSYCGWQYSLVFAEAMMLFGRALREWGRYANRHGMARPYFGKGTKILITEIMVSMNEILRYPGMLQEIRGT